MKIYKMHNKVLNTDAKGDGDDFSWNHTGYQDKLAINDPAEMQFQSLAFPASWGTALLRWTKCCDMHCEISVAEGL